MGKRGLLDVVASCSSPLAQVVAVPQFYNATISVRLRRPPIWLRLTDASAYRLATFVKT